MSIFLKIIIQYFQLHKQKLLSYIVFIINLIQKWFNDHSILINFIKSYTYFINFITFFFKKFA